MFADIGMGIILSVWLGDIFAVNITWSIIIIGIIFVLLPDFDLIFLLTGRNAKMFGGHRG